MISHTWKYNKHHWIKPWGNAKLPKIVQDKADIIVGWNKDSIIGAIKNV